MRSPVPEWQFDESAAVGVDYADPAVAAGYDRQHTRFRDYDAQAAAIRDVLALPRESTVIDMGCGTGGISVPLARFCSHVHAVDVAEAMLAVLRGKLASAGLSNVTCHQAGFLTYEHPGPPVDAVVSIAALHHLPDFWKWVALRRLAGFVKPGGRLYLADVVFPSAMTDYAGALEAMVEGHRQAAGEQLGREAAIHLRQEFSTFDWILERFLDGSGFHVDHISRRESFFTEYVCTRNR